MDQSNNETDSESQESDEESGSSIFEDTLSNTSESESDDEISPPSAEAHSSQTVSNNSY